MNYLDYLNKPTSENVRQVHKSSGMTQPQVAKMLGVGVSTYKSWSADADQSYCRQPHNAIWNLLLYELQARKLGYKSIYDFFKNNS